MKNNNLSREEAIDRAALIRDPRYAITLDLTREDAFTSDTVIRFGCVRAGADTFVDITAPSVTAIELNGDSVSLDAFDGNRVKLRGLREENELRIVASCAFNRTELGMHRFVDPADGNVYVHTHFEPFGAHRVFACFDQPDLKGTFDFTLIGLPGWVAVANAPRAGQPDTRDGTVRWSFETTERIPSYITCVAAGPYHEVREQHRDIDLGLLCRQSLAQYLDSDELLEITRQGFDFFERAFGYPYMFGGKYDQIFVPESNSGAMENAGLVTFNDLYLFRSRVTDAAKERRAETILHEMAHMWFGDLVTMRWWNDLWLNESFASFMAVLSQVGATRWTEGWTTFADTEKTWAYKQDQLPTTHPIVAEVPDVESIHLNFDGITYAKGASVLRQLVAWVGEERFLQGVKTYCQRHDFANAELADFLDALEEASGRDLHSWSKEWLETAGVNTLRARFGSEERDGHAIFSSFSLLQEAASDWPTLRSHRVAVGLFDLTRDGLARRRSVEFDAVGADTEVPDLVGETVPDLLLVNDGDLTYAKIRLDDRSLATLVEHLGDLDDSLARTLCWTACWDMTRDAEMPARDYVRLVTGNIGKETKVGVVQSLLAQASAAVNVYGDPANRKAAMQRFAEATLEGTRAAQPGGDHQLAWARAFVSAAQGEDHLALVKGLLAGDNPFQELVVDTELRWHIVRSLAAAGAADADLIEAEEKRDATDRGSRHAAAARAARATPQAKEEAWRIVVEEHSQPLAMVDEIMTGFQQYGQEELLEPFSGRFFDALPQVWETKDLPDALAFARRMYPQLVNTRETVERTDRYMSTNPVPAPIRRLLLEGKDGVERTLRARAVDAAAS
ncbi:MAG TPA: aminopeptidase N [Actinomycetota bacterium]|nr:aminopeptidase N [Actinomycetota bacterium]